MKNTLLTIWNFYLEGFRSMTLGRTLWVIILLKLFVMFFILKDGLYISDNNFQNPEFNENVLSFRRMDLIEL